MYIQHIRIFAIAIIISIFSTSVGAEEKLKEAASAITSSKDSTAPSSTIHDKSGEQKLADELLKYAETNKDPLAALTAARILTRIPGGQFFSPIEPQNMSPVQQKPLFNYSKLDTSSTPQVARKGIDNALDLALKLGGSDSSIKAQVEKLRNTDFQMGASTCYAYNNLGAWFWWTAGTRGIARNQVMAACRSNTPYGYMCYHSHCD